MSTPGQNEERRIALHDLLDRPVITQADEPEAFRRIAYHEPFLKSWFMERPQWRLLRGRGVYRLERMPSLIMPERGLPRLRSPLAYACLCWALWFAETMATSSRDWFVISELAERIALVAQGRFTLAERKHREALVQALQWLVDLGALRLRDGDTERWVARQARLDDEADVMYEFAESAPRMLANFVYEGLPAVTLRDPRERTCVPTGETATPLARAWRALLLGPVFWRADDPEGYEALESAQEAVQRDLEGALGWELECRLEFAAIWRTTTARHAGGLLVDLYPDPDAPPEEQSTRYLNHPVLLLLGRLQDGVAAGEWSVDRDGAIPLAEGILHDLLGDLRAQYRKHWGTVLGSLNGDELAEAVMTAMRRMGLLRGPDGARRCHVLPPAALIRGAYAPAPADPAPADPPAAGPARTDSPARPVQSTLFDFGNEVEP